MTLQFWKTAEVNFKGVRKQQQDLSDNNLQQLFALSVAGNIRNSLDRGI